MDRHEQQIRSLARQYGVAEHYYNIRGERIQVPLETLAFIVEHLREDREEKLPPVVVSKGRKIFLAAPYSEGEVFIQNENHEEVNRYPFRGSTIPLLLPQESPWGYYRVFVVSSHRSHSILWVFSPFHSYLPPKRMWGLNVALYSLATPRNHGVGDLKDLEILAQTLQEKGGQFLGLLPLYLLEKDESFGFSPYLPSDRLSFEPIYLSMEETIKRFPGLSLSYEEETFQEAKFAQRVDYQKVWQGKNRFFKDLFDDFLRSRITSPQLWEAFERFMKEKGERLRFASLFQALAEEKGSNWQEWPEAIRHLQKETIRQESEKYREQVLYYAFLQWLMEENVAEITKRFPILGFDLPIGSSPRGIENWLIQNQVVFECSIGAPPDDFSPQGQNWGISPLNPWKERQEGYRHFIDLLRFNFRFAKFLRLDHIMGLQRLFWIPRGAHPREGTYVQNFFAERLGILTLESYRHGVVVIGEDLGTVPKSVRRAMEKAGILSTKVFYFEKDSEQKPRHPSLYPSQSFTTLNTHDMPTLLGFLNYHDIQIREKLGIFTPEEAERQRREREEFIENLLRMWQEWGWNEGAPWERFLRFLALTPSLIVALSLDDLLESEQQPNLPGTTTEFPNWRHRLFIPEDLPQRIEKLAQTLQKSI